MIFTHENDVRGGFRKVLRREDLDEVRVDDEGQERRLDVTKWTFPDGGILVQVVIRLRVEALQVFAFRRSVK